MTRQHFEVLARIIAKSPAFELMRRAGFVNDICDWLYRENPRFDENRFKEYIRNCRREWMDYE